MQAGLQTKQEASEYLRKQLVSAMKMGFCLAIILSDLEVDLCEYLDEGIFPTQQVFDFEFSRDFNNYIHWVKSEEKCGYDGKISGTFQQQGDFTICLVTTNKDPETAQKICRHIPHSEKMFKFVIEP